MPLPPSQDTWKLVEKGSKPIWNKYVNTATGESSYQEVTPKVILSSEACNHSFKRIDGAGNVQCNYCFIGQKIVTGIHDIRDGKIVEMTPRL